jgi:hypothetical protein
MTQAPKSELKLFKVPLEGEAKPEPGKVSEMLLEFAQPLLYAEPGGPPNVAAIQSIMQIAELCWNLPVLEATGARSYPEAQRGFDQALRMVPGEISRLLRQLVEDRKTKFAAVPFLVVLRVEGESLEDLRVVAEARMARGEA